MSSPKLKIGLPTSSSPPPLPPEIPGYTLGEMLGKGAFSVVRKCTHDASGKEFAVRPACTAVSCDRVKGSAVNITV